MTTFILVVWLTTGPTPQVEATNLTHEACAALAATYTHKTACMPMMSFEGR